jgi:hypothetical protein
VDLKSLLEESRFAASDFRLVDEETVAGILTDRLPARIARGYRDAFEASKRAEKSERAAAG